MNTFVNDTADIAKLIGSMDANKDVETIREQLVVYDERALPIMLECLSGLKTWQARQAVIYTAIKFARKSNVARKLGFIGLHDKSKRVRHYACALSAFSLDPAFLPRLKALVSESDTDTVDDAQAAINAIEQKRHHLFLDRRNTGQVFWHVGGSGIDS